MISSGKVDTAQEDAIAGTEDNAQVDPATDPVYLADFTTAVTHRWYAKLSMLLYFNFHYKL